jgi:hypothetical protein
MAKSGKMDIAALCIGCKSSDKYVRILSVQNKVLSTAGLRPKGHCSGKAQKKLYGGSDVTVK